jgi:hypothetical protein
MHISLLKEISPAEAALLDALQKIEPFLGDIKVEFSKIADEIEQRNKAVSSILDTRWRNFSAADRDTAIANLTRLQCVSWALPPPPDMRRMLEEKAVQRADGRNGYVAATHVDGRKFESLLAWLLQSIESVAGNRNTESPLPAEFRDFFGRVISRIEAPESGLRLTSLGKNLIAACSPLP